MDSWSGIILPGAVGVDCCPNQTVYLWIFFVLFVIFCFCFFPQTHNWLFEKPFPVFFFFYQLEFNGWPMGLAVFCVFLLPFFVNGVKPGPGEVPLEQSLWMDSAFRIW